MKNRVSFEVVVQNEGENRFAVYTIAQAPDHDTPRASRIKQFRTFKGAKRYARDIQTGALMAYASVSETLIEHGYDKRLESKMIQNSPEWRAAL